MLQSKEKAEKLGLQDIDLVVDQAIYTKVVEILANKIYIDLKNFIVLRMGGFHIALTFIAVIGKQSSDAGLKDLIIESDVFGK